MKTVPFPVVYIGTVCLMVLFVITMERGCRAAARLNVPNPISEQGNLGQSGYRVFTVRDHEYLAFSQGGILHLPNCTNEGCGVELR